MKRTASIVKEHTLWSHLTQDELESCLCPEREGWHLAEGEPLFDAVRQFANLAYGMELEPSEPDLESAHAWITAYAGHENPYSDDTVEYQLHFGAATEPRIKRRIYRLLDERNQS